MNKVFLIGRLTRDVELRRTTSGKVVTSFTLAINRFGNEDTDWIDCQVWGVQAENLEKYCGKGSQIAVSGALRTRTYEKDGRNHKVTEVLCDNIEYLSRKESHSTTTKTVEPTFEPSFEQSPFDIMDNDIEF